MIECIVIDDEKVILDEVCEMINKNENAKVINSYQDSTLALATIIAKMPDVVFLDIEMPGLNGIELAQKISKIDSNIQIVFVTAYEQYALRAFSVSAIHYLLKPVTKKGIDEAIERVERVIAINEDKGQIEKFLEDNNKGVLGRVSVKDRNDIIIIKIADIIYITTKKGKTIIVTKKGSFDSRKSMFYWESKLKLLGFIRSHRSYLVNSRYITRVIHVLGEYKELVLEYCDINIPISRQKVNKFKDWLDID